MFLGSGAPCHWHEQQRFWFLLGELPTPLGDLGGWGRAFLVLKRQALFLRPSRALREESFFVLRSVA